VFLLLSKFLNGVVHVCKWPLAIAAVILAPFAIIEIDLPFLYATLLGVGQPFLYGFMAYLLLGLCFRAKFRDNFFSTFEHELTHAIFAWLCLQRVTRFEASDGSDRSTESHAKGYLGVVHLSGTNWLISIAPYFFPTLLLPLYWVAWFTPPPGLLALVGVICAYHITSTYRETGLHQTDLKQVGYLFAFMFLPTANILIYAASLYYFMHGYHVARQYVFNVFIATFEWFINSLHFFGNSFT
jgi:hypothetical protein